MFENVHVEIRTVSVSNMYKHTKVFYTRASREAVVVC